MEFFNASYSKFDNGFTSLEYSGLILIYVVDGQGNSIASFAVVAASCFEISLFSFFIFLSPFTYSQGFPFGSNPISSIKDNSGYIGCFGCLVWW